jgi:hypothetical protein
LEQEARKRDEILLRLRGLNMNNERRHLLKEIITQLEQIDERLLRISDKEEASYKARTIGSRETPQVAASKAALEDIDRARDSIEDGCEILRGIVA